MCIGVFLLEKALYSCGTYMTYTVSESLTLFGRLCRYTFSRRCVVNKKLSGDIETMDEIEKLKKQMKFVSFVGLVFVLFASYAIFSINDREKVNEDSIYKIEFVRMMEINNISVQDIKQLPENRTNTLCRFSYVEYRFTDRCIHDMKLIKDEQP
jgi:hypothetical protein